MSKQISSYVKMTFYVEFHSKNSVYKCLSVDIMNYSCDVTCCPYGVDLE